MPPTSRVRRERSSKLEIVPIVLGLIVLVLVVRLLAGSADGGRIEDYLRQRGCKLRQKQWTPFGRGWIGEKSDRIYLIEYDDPQGNRRRATVKTSMLSGVYLTDDHFVGPAGDELRARSAEDLRTENAALRAEVERLRRDAQ